MTVKNFRVSIGLDTNSAGVPGVTWALVYVPYGTSINSLTTSTGSLYEPSSHVINSGVWDFDADHFVCSVQWHAYFILVIMFIS